jgi:hypothetical protein
MHKTTATKKATPSRRATKPIRSTMEHGAISIKIHGFSGITTLQ